MTDNPQTTPWQPIETAPRDGSEIMLWWPERDEQYNYGISGITLGRWKLNRRINTSYFTYVGEDDDYDLETRPPTHWAPLPEPPVKDGPTPRTTSDREVEAARQVVSCTWGRYRASWHIDAFGKRRGGAYPHKTARTFQHAIRFLKNLEADNVM